VNTIALAPVEEFRRDSALFLELAGQPETQSRIGAAMKRGFQTRAGGNINVVINVKTDPVAQVR